MRNSSLQPSAPDCSLIGVRSSALATDAIIHQESAWRVPPGGVASFAGSRVLAARWRAGGNQMLEFDAETTAECHVVKIVLRSMNIRFVASGQTVQDGLVTPGMVHVTEPTVPVRCLFRGPYDVLHLYIPNALIAECVRDMSGHDGTVLRSAAIPRKDIVLDSLGRALVEADRAGDSFGRAYADYISMAIVAWLLASASGAAPVERSRGRKLAQWRLKRALDYVEARLGEPLSLAEIASATGLTRMHFAAQFRAATGLRPHEYLLRRRIERAQEMLVTGMAIVDVALSVGFQTQAHFTSVFKRYAGQPPRAWRESLGLQVPSTSAAPFAGA
jgi:AraC family transcriptional regulator